MEFTLAELELLFDLLQDKIEAGDYSNTIIDAQTTVVYQINNGEYNDF